MVCWNDSRGTDVIRRGGVDDLGSLLGLAERYSVHDRHTFARDRVKSGLLPLLECDDRGVVWVMEGAQGVAGYAVVTWGWSVESGGPDALLDEIYVDRRGEGLGSELIRHIIEDCRSRGMLRVFLETEAHNRRARALYLRHGFGVEDSVWMSLALEATSSPSAGPQRRIH